jgi:hypothetical protein
MRLSLFAVCCVLWADDGIHPRAASADYPAHARAGDVTVAAALVPADQARKLFAADLNRAGYVVVEIGVFPEAGAGVQITADDFMLRTARPASARAVADTVDRKENPSRGKQGGVGVNTGATIGYESGSGNDPVSGRRRGVYTSTSVGVDSGTPRYPVAGRDPAVLERELADKALPEGKTAHAVAGYLYFPKPAGKNVDYELTWYAPAGAVRMIVK